MLNFLSLNGVLTTEFEDDGRQNDVVSFVQQFSVVLIGLKMVVLDRMWWGWASSIRHDFLPSQEERRSLSSAFFFLCTYFILIFSAFNFIFKG